MIIVALSEVSVRLWRRCAVYKDEDEKNKLLLLGSR